MWKVPKCPELLPLLVLVFFVCFSVNVVFPKTGRQEYTIITVIIIIIMMNMTIAIIINFLLERKREACEGFFGGEKHRQTTKTKHFPSFLLLKSEKCLFIYLF